MVFTIDAVWSSCMTQKPTAGPFVDTVACSVGRSRFGRVQGKVSFTNVQDAKEEIVLGGKIHGTSKLDNFTCEDTRCVSRLFTAPARRGRAQLPKRGVPGATIRFVLCLRFRSTFFYVADFVCSFHVFILVAEPGPSGLPA